jgi:hypothetical protein
MPKDRRQAGTEARSELCRQVAELRAMGKTMVEVIAITGYGHAARRFCRKLSDVPGRRSRVSAAVACRKVRSGLYRRSKPVLSAKDEHSAQIRFAGRFRISCGCRLRSGRCGPRTDGCILGGRLSVRAVGGVSGGLGLHGHRRRRDGRMNATTRR